MSIFSTHIDRAESVVNSYVTARYSLPISPVPPILRTLSEDIASYFTIRGAYVQDGQIKNEYYTEYKEALKILDQIKNGTIKLSYTNGSLVATASANRFLSSTETYTPIFGLDDPDNWQRDKDEIDAQSTAREG